MNPRPSPNTGDNKSSAPSKIFDALDEALSQQMNFTAQGNFAAAHGVALRVGELIAQLSAGGPIPAEHGRRLAEFQRRHNLARLALLQKRQDLDLKIRKVRAGKKLLAYR